MQSVLQKRMNNSIVNVFYYHFRWIMAKLTEYFEQFALISLEKQDKMDLLFGEHTL